MTCPSLFEELVDAISALDLDVYLMAYLSDMKVHPLSPIFRAVLQSAERKKAMDESAIEAKLAEMGTKPKTDGTTASNDNYNVLYNAGYYVRTPVSVLSTPATYMISSIASITSTAFNMVPGSGYARNLVPYRSVPAEDSVNETADSNLNSGSSLAPSPQVNHMTPSGGPLQLPASAPSKLPPPKDDRSPSLSPSKCVLKHLRVQRMIAGLVAVGEAVLNKVAEERRKLKQQNKEVDTSDDPNNNNVINDKKSSPYSPATLGMLRDLFLMYNFLLRVHGSLSFDSQDHYEIKRIFVIWASVAVRILKIVSMYVNIIADVNDPLLDVLWNQTCFGMILDACLTFYSDAMRVSATRAPIGQKPKLFPFLKNHSTAAFGAVTIFCGLRQSARHMVNLSDWAASKRNKNNSSGDENSDVSRKTGNDKNTQSDLFDENKLPDSRSGLQDEIKVDSSGLDSPDLVLTSSSSDHKFISHPSNLAFDTEDESTANTSGILLVKDIDSCSDHYENRLNETTTLLPCSLVTPSSSPTDAYGIYQPPGDYCNKIESQRPGDSHEATSGPYQSTFQEPPTVVYICNYPVHIKNPNNNGVHQTTLSPSVLNGLPEFNTFVFWLVTVAKSLSLRITDENFQMFVARLPDSPSLPPVRMPLWTVSVAFFSFAESLVQTQARSLLLNVLRHTNSPELATLTLGASSSFHSVLAHDLVVHWRSISNLLTAKRKAKCSCMTKLATKTELVPGRSEETNNNNKNNVNNKNNICDDLFETQHLHWRKILSLESTHPPLCAECLNTISQLRSAIGDYDEKLLFIEDLLLLLNEHPMKSIKRLKYTVIAHLLHSSIFSILFRSIFIPSNNVEKNLGGMENTTSRTPTLADWAESLSETAQKSTKELPYLSKTAVGRRSTQNRFKPLSSISRFNGSAFMPLASRSNINTATLSIGSGMWISPKMDPINESKTRDTKPLPDAAVPLCIDPYAASTILAHIITLLHSTAPELTALIAFSALLPQVPYSLTASVFYYEFIQLCASHPASVQSPRHDVPSEQPTTPTSKLFNAFKFLSKNSVATPQDDCSATYDWPPQGWLVEDELKDADKSKEVQLSLRERVQLVVSDISALVDAAAKVAATNGKTVEVDSQSQHKTDMGSEIKYHVGRNPIPSIILSSFIKGRPAHLRQISLSGLIQLVENVTSAKPLFDKVFLSAVKLLPTFPNDRSTPLSVPKSLPASPTSDLTEKSAPTSDTAKECSNEKSLIVSCFGLDGLICETYTRADREKSTMIFKMTPKMFKNGDEDIKTKVRKIIQSRTGRYSHLNINIKRSEYLVEVESDREDSDEMELMFCILGSFFNPDDITSGIDFPLLDYLICQGFDLLSLEDIRTIVIDRVAQVVSYLRDYLFDQQLVPVGSTSPSYTTTKSSPVSGEFASAALQRAKGLTRQWWNKDSNRSASVERDSNDDSFDSIETNCKSLISRWGLLLRQQSKGIEECEEYCNSAVRELQLFCCLCREEFEVFKSSLTYRNGSADKSGTNKSDVSTSQNQQSNKLNTASNEQEGVILPPQLTAAMFPSRTTPKDASRLWWAYSLAQRTEDIIPSTEGNKNEESLSEDSERKIRKAFQLWWTMGLLHNNMTRSLATGKTKTTKTEQQSHSSNMDGSYETRLSADIKYSSSNSRWAHRNGIIKVLNCSITSSATSIPIKNTVGVKLKPLDPWESNIQPVDSECDWDVNTCVCQFVSFANPKQAAKFLTVGDEEFIECFFHVYPSLNEKNNSQPNPICVHLVVRDDCLLFVQPDAWRIGFASVKCSLDLERCRFSYNPSPHSELFVEMEVLSSLSPFDLITSDIHRTVNNNNNNQSQTHQNGNTNRHPFLSGPNSQPWRFIESHTWESLNTKNSTTVQNRGRLLTPVFSFPFSPGSPRNATNRLTTGRPAYPDVIVKKPSTQIRDPKGSLIFSMNPTVWRNSRLHFKSARNASAASKWLNEKVCESLLKSVDGIFKSGFVNK